jgi:hypothetical protein
MFSYAKCAECGAEFEKRTSNLRTCSKECSARLKRKTEQAARKRNRAALREIRAHRDDIK